MKRNTTLLDQFKNWFNKFKRYTVSYKNGAFHLYNLFNSPETMIESFDKMAFCYHDRAKKMQTSDNIFLKAKMYYCNPEKELWVITSNLHFKKNVLMENLYDRNFPIKYHFINIHIKSQTVVTKSLVNGLVLKDKTWSMFKAGQAITEYHFKNSNERNITLFFTSDWLEKQKAIHADFKDNKLIEFFNSSNTYMILNEESDWCENIHEELMRLSEQNEKDDKNEKIRQLSHEVLINFVHKLNAEILNENHFELNDKDRRNIQRVEQYLNDNLFNGFPGIEKTAQKAGVSPTKLKSDFKKIHNTTVYKYYSDQQMQAAYQLLSQKDYTVAQVAKLLGYENASKFSAVFKRYFEMQPSTLKD